MLITLVAHTPSDYEAWIPEAVRVANIPLDPNTRVGRELFLSLACAGCHKVEGTTAAGKIGPDLTHLMSKQSIAGGALSPVNEENLKRWISNPPAVKPGTLMPKLDLSEQQINDIVLFLQTLK
jgi:cytochrome c oxidase subunit 2